MAQFIKKIEIYSPKILSSKKIFTLSDIHRTNRIGTTPGLTHLSMIEKELSSEIDDVDLILIPGDIINDTEDLKDNDFKKFLVFELETLTQGKPTFISYGNHDQMTKDASNTWQMSSRRQLKEALSPLSNVTVLENSEVQNFQEVSISSFSPAYPYYELEKESDSAFMTEFLQEMDSSLFDTTQYNILLTHAPSSMISLITKRVNLLETNPDLVVSGHMHNGLIPLSKNVGLISPSHELFPKYAHGVIEENGTTFVINGAVNTRVEAPTINSFFKPSANIITLNPSIQKVKKK
mgnify:FL=1